MNNDRGIFVVSVLRMILDSLIYEEKYPQVDRNMSDSNIGARRDRNIRNHLFVLYGIINAVLNGNDGCMDIQIYDVLKCFDALWLEDCMLDLYDTLPPEARDEKLALVYKVNTENYVAVNTSVGQTERVKMDNIVMQGGKWGPLQCSNSMDKIGKKCVEQGENLYTYKGLVKVMPLAMVDDLLAMAKCGLQSTNLNIKINNEIEFKKLKFHTPNAQGKSKCHTMHIGKKRSECPELKVHGYTMEQVSSDTYLGDIISSDGKNKLNIESRVAKGLGIVSQIMDMLKTVSFGEHYFKMALSYRESMLINGVLTNCESWYGLSETEVEQLEEVDKLLLRQVFAVASTCPIEALYLEMGCIPFSLTIKSRRINFLHYLVTREKKEMLNKFFLAQWKYPDKNDWTLQVKSNLEEFGMSVDLDWIRKQSVFKFKNLVKNYARELALDILNQDKSGHSKMDNLFYVELNMQNYFKRQKAQSETS